MRSIENGDLDRNHADYIVKYLRLLSQSAGEGAVKALGWVLSEALSDEIGLPVGYKFTWDASENYTLGSLDLECNGRIWDLTITRTRDNSFGWMSDDFHVNDVDPAECFPRAFPIFLREAIRALHVRPKPHSKRRRL